MFRFYFTSLSTILVNNLNKFFYLISIEDNKIILKRKVIRAIHRITSNKILEINDVINCALRQLICIILF